MPQGHVPGAVNLLRGKMTARRMADWACRHGMFVVYCAGPHCNGADRAGGAPREPGTARQGDDRWRDGMGRRGLRLRHRREPVRKAAADTERPQRGSEVRGRVRGRRGVIPVALALRPNCECCDCDLPNGDPRARICTFECTFCADCATGRFDGRCPNCGGDLVLRPTRPAAMLARFPAQEERFTRIHLECVSA